MDHEDKGCVYTSHGPTSQGKNIVVKAAKYSLENLEGGIITFICPNRILSNQIQVKKRQTCAIFLPFFPDNFHAF